MFLKKQPPRLKKAKETLHLLRKAYHYRKDLLSEEQRAEVVAAEQELASALSAKDEAASEKATRQAEKLLERVGGVYYKQKSWVENVEMLLVAGILAIGIRTFFFQPFKIPTNSMYPTYHGMTAEVYEPGEGPGLLMEALRFPILGAKHYEVTAPADGELLIPIRNDGGLLAEGVRGRNFFILPATKARYTFFVGNRPVQVTVPPEFDFRQVIDQYKDNPRTTLSIPGLGRVQAIRTGRTVKAGEPVLDFEILSGDALFVDRFSYHFVRPKVGDPFVFRTTDISGMKKEERDKYYIKRLVGTPGDELRVEEPVLYRNGEPISGAEAFELNAEQVGEYEGYTAQGRAGLTWTGPTLSDQMTETVSIPEKKYFAMGDNSDESADSRYWGFVPEENIVGRAIFIYWPFTSRWGLSD